MSGCVSYLCYEVQTAGLHSPCAETRCHVPPQDRGDSVTRQAVQDPGGRGREGSREGGRQRIRRGGIEGSREGGKEAGRKERKGRDRLGQMQKCRREELKRRRGDDTMLGEIKKGKKEVEEKYYQG
jgi:hypothetical protein